MTPYLPRDAVRATLQVIAARSAPGSTLLVTYVTPEHVRVPSLLLPLVKAASSTEGAHRACVLLGIIATCRAIKVPAQAYLVWAFERLGTHRDLYGLPLHEITPAAFKNTLT